ncbi:MAG: acyl-CoA thioesterase [Opitutales bacterium]|nr:acyl-CoA thioesterase [Opitutales bacterium]
MKPKIDPEAFSFRLPFEVRDYECDMEGIVNNAVYQNYLEHTRHVFMRGRGVDFAALVREGVHLVVTRIEIDYLWPLRAGDTFWVGVSVERMSPIRARFHQGIFREPDNRPVLKALVTGASLDVQGRPARTGVLAKLFD